MKSGVIGDFPPHAVVQVKQGTYDGQFTFTTTAWDTGAPLEVQITPKLNNSIMSIFVTGSTYNVGDGIVYLDLYRSTVGAVSSSYNLSGDDRGIAYADSLATDTFRDASFSWLDDTSEMSSRGNKNTITYAVACKTNASTAYFNNSNKASMIVMEYAV